MKIAETFVWPTICIYKCCL